MQQPLSIANLSCAPPEDDVGTVVVDLAQELLGA
jgi:hypothetical protein